MTDKNPEWWQDLESGSAPLHFYNMTQPEMKWIDIALAQMGAKLVMQQQEIVRLKDELAASESRFEQRVADLKDWVQVKVTTSPLDMSAIENNSVKVTELLTALTQDRLLDAAITRNRLVPQRTVDSNISSNSSTDGNTGVMAARKQKKNGNTKKNVTANVTKKNVTKRVDKAKLRQYLKDHTWDEAMVTFDISRMTIYRALK